MPQRSRQHVAAFPIVAHTAEEGNELRVVHVRTHIDLTLILGISTRAKTVVLKGIVGEVLIVSVQAGILVVFIGVTEHQLHVVVAEGIAVIRNPLQALQRGLGIIL